MNGLSLNFFNSLKPLVLCLACGVLMLGGLGSPVTVMAASAKAIKFYDDALVRYRKKDYSGASIQLKNALQTDASYLAARVLLGKTLLKLGDILAADATLSDSLERGANRADVVLDLAQTYVAQGKQKLIFEQDQFKLDGLPLPVRVQMLLTYGGCKLDLDDPKAALKFIEQARVLDPKSPDTWTAEVPVRLRMQQFKEANEAVEKAAALAPETPDTQYRRAAVLHIEGKLPAAIAAYERTVKAVPEHVEARMALAGLFIDTGRRVEAAAQLTELQNLAPEDPRAAYLRALLAEGDKKPEVAQEALREITEIIDKFPIDFIRYKPQILMLNGLAHFGLNEPEKARKYFEVFQKTQGGAPTAKPLAQIYLRSASFEQAIEVLEVYLKSHPGDGQAMALLGSALIGKGQFARAATLMQAAIQTRDNPEFHTVLGMSMMRSGQAANAAKELEVALKKDPNQASAATTLITLYLREGQAPKAVVLAENLIKQQPKNAGYLNLLGMVRVFAKNNAAAKVAFDEAIKLDPSFNLPQLNLARIEIADKSYENAVDRLNHVLKTEPKNAEVMFELATIANQRGLSAEAQRWLESAANLAGPRETRWGLALSEFYLQRGQAKKALEAVKLVSAKAPEELPVLLALAKAQLATGDIANLKSTLVTATRKADYNPVPQVQIAVLQLSANNPNGAAYSLEKALSNKADYLPALAMMTDVELRLGDIAKAEKIARSIAAKIPKLSIGYSLLGDVAVAKGQTDAAVEAYRKAHSAQPTADTLMRLVRTITKQNKSKQGEHMLEAWLKTRPTDLVVLKELANSQARSANFAAARNSYESALKIAPDDASVLNNLANVLLRLKDPGAVAVAEKAVQLSPGDANTIDTLGWALFQNGQPERSLQALREAKLTDSGNGDVRYHLAVVLAQKGNKGDARAELETALKSARPFENKADAIALLKALG